MSQINLNHECAHQRFPVLMNAYLAEDVLLANSLLSL